MNFDLNLQNYKKEELEEIFNLPNNYDSSTLDFNGSKLRGSVLYNQNIDENTKKKTIDFLFKAQDILSSNSSTSGFEMTKLNANNVYNNETTNMNLKASPLDEQGEDFIIKKQPTAYGQSLTEPYYPGIINPLKKRVVKQILNIDTRFRDNYYSTLSSDFIFDIPNKFTKVVSLQVSAIEFPTTYYAVSKQNGNNFFKISLDTGVSLVIVIPDGNYTPGAIVAYLNNYLSTTLILLNPSSLFQYIYFALNLDTSNSGSGQIVIGLNSTSPSSFNFTLDFQSDVNGNQDLSTPLPLKFGWMMGFRNGKYSNNQNYVSEGITDFVGSRYLFLVIDDFNNNVINNFYSAFNASMLNKNILARITLQQGSFNIFSQNNLGAITTPRQYFGPVDIQKIRIQLLDEYGRVVNLNNMDFSFCLTLETIYDL